VTEEGFGEQVVQGEGIPQSVGTSHRLELPPRQNRAVRLTEAVRALRATDIDA
jgi:hypothetical protein